MSDRVAICPGSFDPPTNGHLDIVERSSRLFDRVVVGVGRNLAKKTVFSDEERIQLMREACAKYKNVEVELRRIAGRLRSRVRCQLHRARDSRALRFRVRVRD